MTKQELINELSTNHSLPRDKVASILNDITGIQVNCLLNEGEVTLHGIGKLKVVDRAARLGRNPKTGETIQIAATRSIKFSTTKDLKVELNAE